jgi:predicted PurR-regulated permease PerM
VILLYLGVQGMESYLVTLLVEERTISLPPARILTVQMLMGVLLGSIGLIIAVSLCAAILMLVNRSILRLRSGSEDDQLR